MGETSTRAEYAAVWLVAVAAVVAVWVVNFADLPAYALRAQSIRMLIEQGAALITGVLAVLAAARVNGTRASRLWLLAPMPTLAIWVGAMGVGCIESLQLGLAGRLIEGAECFGFLTALSSILVVSLLVPLYRRRPRASAAAVAMAGLGVAALAATVLHFFHPFAPTPLDVTAHAAAAALIIAAAVWSRRLVPQL